MKNTDDNNAEVVVERDLGKFGKILRIESTIANDVILHEDVNGNRTTLWSDEWSFDNPEDMYWFRDIGTLFYTAFNLGQKYQETLMKEKDKK